MTPENKTVSVYIPDELRKRAEQADINLSATLRDAVEEELARRETIEGTLSNGIEEHEVELDTGVTGVITGKYLGDLSDGQIYLTDDERVLFYDSNRERVEEIEDPETEMNQWLEQCRRDDEETITGAMLALGLKPRVRL